MRLERGWLPYIGLGLVAATLVPVFWLIPIVSQLLAFASAALFFGGIVRFIKPYKDRFDLSELRRIDEEAALGEIDVPDALVEDYVLCLNCQDEYPVELKVCPRCKRPF